MKNSVSTNGAQAERAQIHRICQRYDNRAPALIEVLHDVQEASGFISEAAQAEIAGALNITRAEVHGVTSYYDDFRTEVAPGTIVRICRGEACQSMGAENLLAATREATKGRKHIGVEAVYCLGNCALAPAATVNGKLHGRLEGTRLSSIIDEVAK